MMKKFFPLLALLALSQVRAATFTAADATQAEVQKAVNLATHGDTVKIPTGTVTWATSVNIGKNITLQGNGVSATVITIPAAGGIIATGTGTVTAPETHQLRITGLTLRTASTSGAGTSLILNGVKLINADHVSGGVRVDHVIFDGLVSAKTIRIDGWMEGVFDHDIMDHDLGVILGETLIVNHWSSPSGTGNYGDYSWGTPYSLAGEHQLVFEDCIFKHNDFVFDTGQYASSGGALYTVRHCTLWGSAGGGHGTRETGGKRVQDQRAGEVYKNLFVRNSTGQLTNTSKFTATRAGELAIWGNRYVEPGIQAFEAAKPINAYAYARSYNNAGAFEPPDGVGQWDLNQRGAFSAGGNSYTVDVADTAPRGDIYAHGTGGSLSGTTLTLTGLATSNADHWKGFVVRDLVASANPNKFAYINSSGPNTVTIAAPKVGTSPTFTGAWEIRRVQQYFGVPGSGSSDGTANNYLDSTQSTVAKLVGGAPNPRWPGQTQPGLWEWDNKYTVSASPAPSFSPIPAPYDLTDPVIAGHNATAKTGYPYTAGTAAGTIGTLVGADAEVWAIAPSGISSIPGATSITTEAGTGGYAYPHPLITGVAPGGTPTPTPPPTPTITPTPTPPANQPPACTIMASPPIAIAPADIALSASATDNDGTIAHVEFYRDVTLINNDTTFPYAFTDLARPIGTYSYTAKAFDNSGASTVSVAVVVNVTVSGQIVKYPYGFYPLTNGGATSMSVAGGTDPNGVLAKPFVSGFRLRITLADIQPDAFSADPILDSKHYDWTLIDNAIADATLAGNKKVGVSVAFGRYCPAWVFSPQIGCYKFLVDPADDSIAGQLWMPLPWDPPFLNVVNKFIDAFGARYDTNPAVTYVAITGFQQLVENRLINVSAASVPLTGNVTNTTVGALGKIDCPTGAFTTRTGIGGANASVLNKFVTGTNIRGSTMIIGVADGAPADPTATTVYTDKTPFTSGLTGQTVLVREWLTGLGDEYKCDQYAKNVGGYNDVSPVSGDTSFYGVQWPPFSTVGFASTRAYLPAVTGIMDRWTSRCPNTPMILTFGTVPFTNAWTRNTGDVIKEHLFLSPLGGVMTAFLKAICPADYALAP